MQGKSIQGKERKRNRNAVPVSARCWIDSAASLNLALGVMLKHYSAKLSAVFCPSFGAHTWTKMFLLPVRALARTPPCHFWKLSLHLRSKLPEIVREEWSRNDHNVAIKSLGHHFWPLRLLFGDPDCEAGTWPYALWMKWPHQTGLLLSLWHKTRHTPTV